MIFTHDTEEALQAATALVNSESAGADELLDAQQFEQFVGQWQWTGVRTYDEAERRWVRALRPSLRTLWQLRSEDETVQLVNALLVKGRALPQLVRHEGWEDYHLHATSRDTPLATRWMVEVAMAMVDVVRAGQLSRLQICAAEDCENVLVDLSKNRSRRFCEAGCGNRTNVAAYRARQRAVDEDSSVPGRHRG